MVPNVRLFISCTSVENRDSCESFAERVFIRLRISIFLQPTVAFRNIILNKMAANHNVYDPPPPYTAFPQQPIPSAPSMYGSTGTTTVIITPNPNPAETIVIVGGCPACRVGVLEEEFTCLGLLCFILFFPLGILCCLALRQRRCLNCGAVF